MEGVAVNNSIHADRDYVYSSFVSCFYKFGKIGAKYFSGPAEASGKAAMGEFCKCLE